MGPKTVARSRIYHRSDALLRSLGRADRLEVHGKHMRSDPPCLGTAVYGPVRQTLDGGYGISSTFGETARRLYQRRDGGPSPCLSMRLSVMMISDTVS